MSTVAFKMSKVLDSATRREAFLRLVRLQDQGYSVSASFERVAADYQISVPLLQMIEREGLKNEWPPLNNVAATGGREQNSDKPTTAQNAAPNASLCEPPVNSLERT